MTSKLHHSALEGKAAPSRPRMEGDAPSSPQYHAPRHLSLATPSPAMRLISLISQIRQIAPRLPRLLPSRCHHSVVAATTPPTSHLPLPTPYRSPLTSYISHLTAYCLLFTFYLLLALSPGSTYAAHPTPPTKAPPFNANLSWGNVEIIVRAEPPVVMLEHDLNVTITITLPAHQTLTIPDLRDRFQGFTIAEGFSRDPIILADGQRSHEYRWRLVPGLAAEYRLAPFAVTLHDPTTTPHERSFATRPLLFPIAERDATITGEIELSPRPYWIPPTRRDYFHIALLVGLAAVIIIFVIRLLRYLKRQVTLRRMAPHERALVELEALLRLQLPARGLFKDFYVELTQVVRRYIERAHAIRAPQQTTPEFLASARNHPDFPQNVLGSLRAFLEAADLIKFARQETNVAAAEAAIATARTYITDDAAARAATPTSIPPVT